MRARQDDGLSQRPRSRAADDPRIESLPLADLARFREETYSALSKALFYPDDKRLSSVVATARGLWRERVALAPLAAFGHWSRLLRDLQDLGARAPEKLQEHYVSLFMVGATEVPCPPYESVYRERAGRPTGWLLVQVEAEYAAAGLALSSGAGELPDHVAVELEFMAFLCDREARAWDEGKPRQGMEAQRRQRAFLSAHLSLWLPAFARRLGKVDRDGIYPALGSGANTFVSYDRDLLDILLEIPMTASEAS